jgi:hypothetical protein
LNDGAPSDCKKIKTAYITEARTITTPLPEGQNNRNESLEWFWNLSFCHNAQNCFEAQEAY